MAVVLTPEEFRKQLVVEALRGRNNSHVLCGSGGHCRAQLRTFCSMNGRGRVVPSPWHVNNSQSFRCGAPGCCNVNGNYDCAVCWGKR